MATTVNSNLDRILKANKGTNKPATKPAATKVSTYKRPTKSSIAMDKYVQTLGFKPKDLPEVRDRKTKRNIAWKALDLLDRAGSGMRYAALQDFGRQQNLKKQGAGKFRLALENYNPTRIDDLAKDFWKGATGDINVTGRDLVSRVFDDPYVRKDLGDRTKRVVDNEKFRSVAGIGLDIGLDPMNAIPLSAPFRVVGKGSKVIGLTDNVLKPVAKRVGAVDEIVKIRKGLGGMRDEGFKKLVSDNNTQRAMAANVGELSRKLMRGELKTRDTVQLKALVAGLAKKNLKEKEAKRVISLFEERVDNAIKAAENIKGKGGKIDQKQLYEYLTGSVPEKLLDSDYKNLSAVGRSLQDDLINPLLKKNKVLSKEVLDEGTGKYVRKFYVRGKEIDLSQLQTYTKGSKLGAERGALKMEKKEPLRAIEYLRNNNSGMELVQEFDSMINDMIPLTKSGKQASLSSNKLLKLQNQAAKKLEPQLKKVLGDDYMQVVLEQRRASGLIDDADLALAMSAEQGLDLAVTSDFLKKTSAFAAESLEEAAEKGYKKIPKEAKYGSLGGKFVPDVIYDDVVGLIDPSNTQWKKIINSWKMVKLFAPFNTASNARNMISDMVANSMVEGGPSLMKQMLILPKVIKEYQTGGKLYKEAVERGVLASTFANQEARRTMAGLMGKQAGKGIGDYVQKGSDLVTQNRISQFKTPLPGVGWGTEAYAYTSDIGKLVQIQHQLSKGKSWDEAIKMAEKATFDYSKLPVSLRKVRDNFMPFMTYKYFAGQLVWDTLMNRTGKITRLTHMRRGVEGLTEDKANERDLPAYMKSNRAMYMRTPLLDSRGNPRYLDMSYILPMGDFGETSFTDYLLGNPFMRTGVELGMNKNLFLNKPIVEDYDDTSTRIKKRAQYIAKQFMPNSPVLPGTSGFKRLSEAARGKETSQGVKTDLKYVVPEVFGGVKLREVNPKQQRKFNRADAEEEKREIQAQINRVRKNKDLSGEKKKKEIKRLRKQLSNVK